MLKHILVPLDGSRLAESALPAAAALAAGLEARITLFHVIEKAPPADIHGQSHLRTPEEAAAYLEETAARAFPQARQVACHVHTTAADDVAGSIVAHADELGHDLIVMCSHGRGRALHLILGSIAQEVVSRGALPVLMTRPGAHGEIPAFSCARLLVPLDAAPGHTGALPLAAGLTGPCGAELYLIMVIPEFGTVSGAQTVPSRFLPATMTKLLEMSVQEAEDFLRDQLAKLKDQGISARARVLRGDPGRVIVETAGELDAGMIILATHGKSGIKAFWEGSVGHKVASLYRGPLLLIPVGTAP